MRIRNIFLIGLILAAAAFSQDPVSKYRGVVSYLIDVASGRIPGESIVNKFGANPAVATTGEDVWAGGGTYNFYPDTAHVMQAVFDSSADSVTGTGGRTIIIYGLDSNYSEINETINAGGSDTVALVNMYIRMYRAIVLTAGSYESNKGGISIQDTTGTLVGAYIAANTGQTQQCIYTIPAGKTGYFLKGYVAMRNTDKNGQDASFRWKLRTNNGMTGAWATNGEVTLINIGSSWWQYEYGAPAGPLLEKTDIKIECYNTSAESGAVGGFDILLKTNQ